MGYIGFRANEKKHKEILQWLSRFENQSEEVRRLLELGIRLSQGSTIPPKPLTWTFPNHPTVRHNSE